MINKIILLLFICVLPSFAQLNSNLFFKKILSGHYINSVDSLNSIYNNSKLKIGIDFTGTYKNSAHNHYDNYNDKTLYLVSPYLNYKLTDSLMFTSRVNIENIRDDYVYGVRTYWGDEFVNHRGDFEIAKIEYDSKYFSIKFGRDYFMPGIYLYENLLFSKYNYPYDQINLVFHNDYFEISTYYLSLNSAVQDGINYQRHLNGHRFTVKLANGYFAFNDVILYGGENQALDIMAFNPLLLFYPYHENKKHITVNQFMSVEFYYTYSQMYFFLELLLDDYQIEKETPGDLEPNEWGVNTTFGINNVFDSFDWKINYTRVANRTYNTPNLNFEKYIYKNYPIGHFLGNNFWEMKTSFIIKALDDKLLTDVTFYHYEYGDEALYGAFNTDFLDYTIEEGYDEDFLLER